MGVTKTVHKEGNGPIPTKGQKVSIEYTGFIKDTGKPDNKGSQYVPSLPAWPQSFGSPIEVFWTKT